MRVFAEQASNRVLDTQFEAVVDLEGADVLTVSVTEEGKVSLLWRNGEQEIGVYLTSEQMDRLVQMWDKPHRLVGGLPLAYYWREPK